MVCGLLSLKSITYIPPLGSKPSTILGTRAILAVRPKLKHFPDDGNMWGIILEDSDGPSDTIVVQVRIPPISQIGIWRCSIQTNVAGEKHKGNRRDYEVSFIIKLLKYKFLSL